MKFTKTALLAVFALWACTLQAQVISITEAVEEDVSILTPAKHEQRLQNRRHAQNAPENELEKMWAQGKQEINKLGLDIGVDISYLAQRAAPGGKQTAIQGVCPVLKTE